MIPLTIHFQEDAWPELRDKQVVYLGEGSPAIQIAVRDGRLESGRPSVSIRLDLPDGTFVIAETTARLFCTAGRAIQAKYSTLFTDD